MVVVSVFGGGRSDEAAKSQDEVVLATTNPALETQIAQIRKENEQLRKALLAAPDTAEVEAKLREVNAAEAKTRGELKALREKIEAEELAAKIAELEALKARVREFEGSLPKTVEEALGKPGVGVTMNKDLADPNTAVIYSMFGPLQDPLLGEIYLPNKNEGKAFLVEIHGPFPKFVRASKDVVIPAGFVPTAHPDRMDKDTGLYLLVFAKEGALVKGLALN